MQVSNVSIVKANSVELAINASISEFYNESYAQSLNSVLVVDDFIGSCVDVCEAAYGIVTTNTYFIVTAVGGMYRVEHCSERVVDYK